MEDSLSTVRSSPDLDHLERIHRSFNSALAAFQAEHHVAKRDGINPHFRNTYSTLESVVDAIRPAAKHGLSHTETTRIVDGNLILEVTIRHIDGYEITSELPISWPGDWQKFGSAMSYAKRYALIGIFGIASSDDDDGEAAADPRPAQPAKAKASSSKTAASKAPAANEAPPSPFQPRIDVIGEALKQLHESSPEAIQELASRFKQAFKLPPNTTIARNLDKEEHVAWMEEQLSIQS